MGIPGDDEFMNPRNKIWWLPSSHLNHQVC